MPQAILILAMVTALSAPAVQAELPEQTEVFDEALAAELGADDYGMRRYVMAFLSVGPNQDQTPEEAAELQRGHMAHIQSMAASGQLVLAGPFLDGAELRGVFLFAVETIEEAQALTAADPAVQAGRLVMELKPWYGSAALMKVNELHARIARENP